MSKLGGMYLAEWRTQTYELFHLAAGKTLSLRGTRGVAIAGSKRYLASIAEEDRPDIESYGTIRLHDIQAHTIQRCKALESSFGSQRGTYQWDEWTGDNVAWVVQSVTCKRGVGEKREREVLGASKVRTMHWSTTPPRLRASAGGVALSGLASAHVHLISLLTSRILD